ncbi:MAG: translation initiation factor IF-2 [Negativicutes bacterium]|nr:translation initiation factor IF-2 [Negativicutes bacterium]
MSKYRVYEIAKDYNTTSKVIIDILARNGIVAKNHMTSIDDDARTVIERTFARKTGPAETSEVKPPPKAPARQVPSDEPLQPARTPLQQGGGQPARSASPQQGGNQVNPPNRHPKSTDQRASGGGANRHQMDNRPQQPASDRQRQHSDRRPDAQQSNRHFTSQGSRPANPQHNINQNNRLTNQPHNAVQGSRPAHQPYSANQGNRPANQPYNAGQGGRPANQNFNRNPNSQGQGTNQRPGDRPQQRPGQNQTAKPTAAPPPSQSRVEQPRRGKADQSQQSLKEKQQSQREQIFNKKHAGKQGRFQGHSQPTAKQEPVRPKLIKIGDTVTVKDLAAKLGRQVSEVIKKLMMLGVMATINQEIDFDTASLIATEFGASAEALPPEENLTEIAEVDDDPATLLPRPPVVTIMGHVDHGKTSLLDSIRLTHVTAQEAGGITQHIGAYSVNYQGKKIVFLDTPGHEAFTAMRARGAQVTDIAILVVAADDGVMPQTIEALNHAKSAKVPIIVAINKMDKADANPDRVKQQLSEHGLVPEEWGGDTIFVPVSAYKKTGIPELLEMILLVAEIQELRANPQRAAMGTIIEAQLDKGRGPVATVLVQKGTLHIGDSIIAGSAFGKVRAMVNDRGEKVKKAEPSTPVEVLGLSDVPQAGDILVVADEKVVRAVAEKRAAKKRTEELQQTTKVSLDDLFKQIQEGSIKDLNIVVKADVQGSIEALRQALQNLKNKEVRVNIVHAGVGAINESDVMLASASNALIIGFNVRPDANARKAAETEKIDLRTYRVIYDAINDVEAAMSGMLAPEYKEVIQGRAEVRQIIPVPKTVVAGSYVLEGKITNNSQIRLLRNGIVVYEGKIEALRRFKDDVKEVASGYECGISLEKFRDIKEGDIIEAFTMEVVK